MSIVLIRSARRPVIRIAASPVSTRSRAPPRPRSAGGSSRGTSALLLTGYLHAAVTLNFVRALSAGGLADLRRPEYFDLSYFERAALSPELPNDYRRVCREISDGLNFVCSFGDRAAEDLMKVEFFASHEGLNLMYESAQMRRVPRRHDFYDLTTHMPWIGERTRALDGAFIEFFRGIANPIAIKLGPKTVPAQAVDLCKVLNPRNEPGKIVLVPRMGAKNVAQYLPSLVTAIQRERRRVLWVCDPKHGNATVTRAGIKTRNFDDIVAEIEASMDVHNALGTYFGGVHFALTGDDVRKCVGGGLDEHDLSRNYESLCDPRLNYRQALQMAFSVARRLAAGPPPPSYPPESP